MNIDELLKHAKPSTRSALSMDGLVLAPQPSALHADVEFNVRTAPGDSNITLWQFLRELLADGGYPHLIQWTNPDRRDGEFKLLNAEGVAQLWGRRKGKEHMNYDKLSRALRYYYDKNIIKKVVGQKFVYRFVSNPDSGESWQHSAAPPRHNPEPLSYLQQYARVATANGGMKNIMAAAHLTQDPCKTEDHMMPYIPSSTSLTMTPQMNTSSDLASLNLSTSSNDTPSPTDSSCSPNSMCSSSGVSSAVPTAATTPPCAPCSSRPGSAHSEDGINGNMNNNCYSRKRKASPPPPIHVEKDSQPAPRRSRPENLNLAATQYLNPTLPMVISPMNVIQQMSPFVLSQQMQLYALACTSASLGPNSPLFSGLGVSPLSTPKMPQVFQFPPVSTSASMVNSLANLMSPAFMNSNHGGGVGSIFKFPANDTLKTPTIPSLAKTPVPVANSDS